EVTLPNASKRQHGRSASHKARTRNRVLWLTAGKGRNLHHESGRLQRAEVFADHKCLILTRQHFPPCVSIFRVRWLWLGLKCSRGSSKPPPQRMTKLKFVSGAMRTLFPKSPSLNIESKECSQQDAGTTQRVNRHK